MARDMIDGGDGAARRNVWQAMLKGLMLKCPNCGKGPLFDRYLKVAAECPSCGQELHHHRADDAPAYFTIVLVGHIVVAAVLAVEKAFQPSTMVHLALWVPLTLGLSLWLLPSVKGALVGLQWALRMHGFGGVSDAPLPRPAAD